MAEKKEGNVWIPIKVSEDKCAIINSAAISEYVAERVDGCTSVYLVMTNGNKYLAGECDKLPEKALEIYFSDAEKEKE